MEFGKFVSLRLKEGNSLSFELLIVSQTWIIVGLFLLNVSMRSVEADIECHYCGMRDTCTLPYMQTSASKITCQDSCMKFDGKDPNGKRVVVRSCGKKNLTKCEMEQKERQKTSLNIIRRIYMIFLKNIS